MHSEGDVWLEDGFIFRVWWFQSLLLVGGSIDGTSQGPELLGLSTSPQLDQLLILCVVALGELCLCHLHYSSLGILLGHLLNF